MVTDNHYRWDFIGLSTDTKPTPATSKKVVDGSTYYCSDTSKLYVYCTDDWYERKPLGGGGGGGSYTAGNGIDITDDTISVDTNTIQEKLTAGTGIDITDNTISATGGGSITPVQTTGTSTTDVMSQNATTEMVFADAGTNQKVQIGSNASASGGSTVSIGRDSKAEAVSATAVGRNADAKSQASTAIGYYAYTNGEGSLAIGENALGGSASNALRAVAIGSNASAGLQGSIAVGAYSYVTSVGEMNIGAYNHPEYGYNYSTYRLLSGVYDGQNAHDAVTVGQVNSVIDAINTALSTNIPHIGA